ncbi:MAG: AEC family transporter [Prevotella sp.]|nr:AEC family transporter [Prevotella sp.]
MKAIEILFPVFFMMLLGWLSNRRGWVTAGQNEGAKALVFNILFPLLVFHILVKAELTTNFLYEIVFLDAAWAIIYLVGRRLSKPIAGRYAHLAPFLLMTCEGGSVALPLYLTLVGAAHAVNIVTFDVAGILINFGLVPALVTRQTAKDIAFLPLLKRILTAPFIIAVMAGIAVNLSGLHRWLMLTDFHTVYNGTMTAATAPIASIILFTLGYEFHLRTSQLKPLLRLTIMRLLLCGAIVTGFFLLFPQLMAVKVFLVGVLLYFACPTGFPVPLQIEPLCKDEDDESFMSAFISIFIILAMTAYAMITLFIL